MEPDPIVLAWRAAVALALGLGGPLCILALLCLRDLVHTLGHDEATALVFLRVAIARTADDFVLVPGWSLAPLDLERAAFFGLSACALALAGLGWFVAALSFSAQSRAGDGDAQEDQCRRLVVSQGVDEVAQAEQGEDAERAAEAER
ncbi:hypothetical protein FV223_18205, partial [Methylobacterium sp. WL116]